MADKDNPYKFLDVYSQEIEKNAKLFERFQLPPAVRAMLLEPIDPINFMRKLTRTADASAIEVPSHKLTGASQVFCGSSGAAVVYPAAVPIVRRKRGPRDRTERYAEFSEAVGRLAPDGDWRPRLYDICEELDKLGTCPPPSTWKDERMRQISWSDQLIYDPEKVRKIFHLWLGHSRNSC